MRRAGWDYKTNTIARVAGRERFAHLLTAMRHQSPRRETCVTGVVTSVDSRSEILYLYQLSVALRKATS
ncbi:MAG: hypothetical protein M3R15_27825, partial [Acidobacteriota bacterium]|nr:hypothetical protein [Acidobacteriota bacterium]